MQRRAKHCRGKVLESKIKKEKGDEERMCKSITANVLKTVAKASGETASFFGLYEPKMPEDMLKRVHKTEECQSERKDV